MIGVKERERIWIPEIGFANSKTGSFVKDEYSAMMVMRNTNPLPLDDKYHMEDHIFLGHENHLFFLRRYYAEYHCTFNLRFFPFDDQRCIMVFRIRTATEKSVILKAGDIIYEGPKTLVEFVITNMTMMKSPHNVTRSEIWVLVEFARQYGYHLSQSFFQSFLLGFLACLTFWIDIDDFNDRFMGSLTCLLVLASLMASMTSALPNTSYFKAIDVWLLYFMLSTSVNIAMHILIDKMRLRELTQTYSQDIMLNRIGMSKRISVIIMLSLFILPFPAKNTWHSKSF